MLDEGAQVTLSTLTVGLARPVSTPLVMLMRPDKEALKFRQAVRMHLLRATGFPKEISAWAWRQRYKRTRLQEDGGQNARLGRPGR